ALATIGACKLADGHAQQALAFLRKALDGSSDDFLGRADAEADLGLAMLSLGDESGGLAQLHSAREKWLEMRESLLLCLDNEIRYLEKTQQIEPARQRREERARWEAKN